MNWFLSCMLFCSLLQVSVSTLSAQVHEKEALPFQGDAPGTHFIVGFMQNDVDEEECPEVGDSRLGKAWILISSDNTANVQVTDPSGTVQMHQILAGRAIQLSWPLTEVECVGEGICDRSIDIISDNPVSVSCLNSRVMSSDGYLALPVDVWGLRYVSANYVVDQYLDVGSADFSECSEVPRRGEFAVIASEDNTVVQVRPPVSSRVQGHPGETMTKTLMKGQIWQVQDGGERRGGTDISGAVITADKPVGLLSGHMRTAIPFEQSTKNHLVEMLPPTERAGRHYVVIPFAERSGGDLVRVMATEYGTTKFRVETPGGTESFSLEKPGDYRDLSVTQASTITGDRPVMVVQYGKSNGVDPQTDFDPSMMVLTPEEQFVHACTFQTLDERRYWMARNILYQYDRHYLSIVTEKKFARELMLNGRPLLERSGVIGTGDVPGPESDLMWIVYRFEGGLSMRLESRGEFAAYIYGTGKHDAYAWPLGGNREDLFPPDIVVKPTCPGGSFEVLFSEGGSADAGLASVEAVFSDGTPVEVIGDTDPLETGASSYRLHLFPGMSRDSTRIIASDLAGNSDTMMVLLRGSYLEFDSTGFLLGVLSRGDSVERQVQMYSSGGTMPVRIDSLWFNPGTFAPFADGFSVVGENGRPVGDTLIYPGDTLKLIIKLRLGKDRVPSTADLSGFLVIRHDCQEINLSMFGRLRVPNIGPFGARSIEFGDVLTGDTVCREVAVESTGEEPLVIDGLSLDLSDGFFLKEEFLPSFPIVLPPGSHFTFIVCYVPDQVKRNIDVVMVSSDAIGKRIFQIPLFGSGVNDILSVKSDVRSETESGGAFFENGTVVVVNGETDLKNYAFVLYSALGRQIPVKSQVDRSPGRIRLTPSEILPSGAYYLNGVNADGEILMEKFVVIR